MWFRAVGQGWMQSSFGGDYRAVSARERLSEQVFCEACEFFPPRWIEACGRPDTTDLPLGYAEPRLQLSQEESDFDGLGPRIGMDFVEDQPTDICPGQQCPVSRQEQDVLEHGVVCDEDVRWVLKHLAPCEKPVARSVARVGEIGLKGGRGGQSSFFVRSLGIRAHLPGEAPERDAGVAKIPKQQPGDTVHLVVCEGVERIDQNRANAGPLQFSLTQEIVDQWEEKRLRLARAGTRGDQIVFVATDGC